MNKKLLSVLLAMVMIIGTLSGCGSKGGSSYSSIVREVNDIKTGEFEMELGVTVDEAASLISATGLEMLDEYLVSDKDEIKVSLKFTGVIESTDPVSESVNVSYKMGTMSSYKDLTEVIVKDDAVYMNVKTLLTAVEEYVPDIADEISLDKDYVGMTMSEIEDNLGYKVSELTTTDEIEGVENPQEFLTETVYYIIETLEKATKSTDLFEKSDKGYSLSLDDSNLIDVTEAIVNYLDKNAESVFDEYVKTIEKLDGDNADMIAEIKEQKSSFIETVSELVETFDKDEVEKEFEAAGIKFSIDSYAECTGKEGKREASSDATISAECQGIKGKLTVSSTLNEKTGKKVEVPAEDAYYKYSEIAELLGAVSIGDENGYDTGNNTKDTDKDKKGDDKDKKGNEKDNSKDNEKETGADETTALKENPVADTQVKLDPSLSTSLSSGQVQFDGKVLTLPANVSDIIDMGWALSDMTSDKTTIAANDYDFVYFEKGDYTVSITLTNDTDADLPYDKCKITEVYVSSSGDYNKGVPVCLPGGIQVGSTYEQVLAAYGKPDYESEYTTDVYYGYGPADAESLTISINVDKETGLVNSISISYYE